MKRGKLGVGQLFKPALEFRIGVQRGLQLLAVAQLDHAPAAGAEDLVEALEHAVGARRVEALAVVVDDPPQVSDVVLVALDQRFVDVALVELRVADQRDEAAPVGLVHHAVRGKVVLDQAGEGGDRDTQADRAGREVDGDLVLGTARIALRTAETAEILESLSALRAEQIMDCMQHRTRVRLHRDPVVGAECVEIERGHDARHRRAACLVPADLQPVAIVADVVGVMDCPRRKPAQPLVEDLQRFNVGRDGLEHIARLDQPGGSGKVRALAQDHPIALDLHRVELAKGLAEQRLIAAEREGEPQATLRPTLARGSSTGR